MEYIYGILTLPAQPQGTVSYSFLKLGGFRLTYWDLDVSSFFLSFFSQSASSSTCLIGFLSNSVRSMYGCMATKLMGLKIHPGSPGTSGVKNVKRCSRTTKLGQKNRWSKLNMMMTFIEVKGHQRSNVVNYVLWQPNLVRRIPDVSL